jgi:hypothetical protein
MTPAKLVKLLEDSGIRLAIANDNIRYKPTPDKKYLELLRKYKPDVMSILASKNRQNNAPKKKEPATYLVKECLPCKTCGGQKFWVSIHKTINCMNCHPYANLKVVAAVLSLEKLIQKVVADSKIL